jgi:hypothetical protein
MYTAYLDVQPTMMLLYLIVASIFCVLKWQGTLTQGKEQDGGIGFRKNNLSIFILIMPQQLAFRIILASIVTL